MAEEMRIERVDDRTVKCFLSNEELEEYDIDYKDFVTRSEKAKELVQEIMEQASEEVGYQPPRFAFDVQIMVVPDQGMVLTFSDKDAEVSSGSQLLDCLREMKRLLQRTREITEQGGAEQNTDAAREENGKAVSEKKEQTEQPAEALFAFSSLRNVMNYAMCLPGNLRVESSLYEEDGIYLLHLKRGHAAYGRYGRACVQALEFSALQQMDENRLLRLKEQKKCLIEEKALKKLRV